MILGYNTNGFAHHRLNDALAIIAEFGYRGVALTPDVNHFNPFRDIGSPEYDTEELIELFQEQKLQVVIETGARFLLDPRRKHQPTLISSTADGRFERYSFLQDCVYVAKEIGARELSFWSGTPTDDASPRALMVRLTDGCRRLADVAAKYDIRLAFEPEPGMFIDTMEKFADLHAAVNHPNFGLTLDVGHLVCTGELPVSEHIKRWKRWLWNVHIEDMRPGVHDHLMFGEGTVDFADVFAGLRAIDYAGMVSVELSRHSYDAVTTARRAKAFLDPFVND